MRIVVELTLLHEDSDSSVDEDALLHGEALLVVSSGDSESVTLELFSQNDSVHVRTHSSVVEVTAKARFKGQWR